MSENGAVIELAFADTEPAVDAAGYAVAHVLRSTGAQGMPAVGERVLAPLPAVKGPVVELEASRCVRVPRSLADDHKLVVPQLAFALWVWDVAGVELGELTTYTSGSRFERLISLVATWRSGRDALRLNVDDGPMAVPRGTRGVDATTPQRAIEEIQRAIRDACGFAAVVLTSRPEVIEILLEAMPVWGRLVIATAVAEPATVDFYNNVHRKGVRAIGVPSSPMAVFDAARTPEVTRYVDQAIRILSCDHLAAPCMASVE